MSLLCAMAEIVSRGGLGRASSVLRRRFHQHRWERSMDGFEQQRAGLPFVSPCQQGRLVSSKALKFPDGHKLLTWVANDRCETLKFPTARGFVSSRLTVCFMLSFSARKRRFRPGSFLTLGPETVAIKCVETWPSLPGSRGRS